MFLISKKSEARVLKKVVLKKKKRVLLAEGSIYFEGLSL